MSLVPRSLLWRTLWVFIAALLVSQATTYWLFERYVAQPRMERSIGHFVSHLRTISAALQAIEPARREVFLARFAEREGIRVSPTPPGPESLQPVEEAAPIRFFRARMREVYGEDVQVLAREEDLREGRRPPVVWVRLPVGDDHFWITIPRGRVVQVPATAFAVSLFGALLLAIFGTYFLMWRLNRPLGELARAAVAIGHGADPPPVAETGPTEIRAVARAFNQMKEDLAKGERERATFLAGISHDLRTPLTRLRLDVEMLEGRVDAAVQRGMVSDLADMNAIIDQFIDFTRTEASEPVASVDLAQVAAGSAERLRRSGASVHCDLAPVPALPLRPLALQRAVENLLVNAARHAGGEIVVRTSAAPGEVRVAVLDRGPGIPPEMVERLKLPFTRRDAARSGSSGAGLGLAIATRVAQLHGGRLELLPREGGGLEARLVLPCAAAS
jgi:two-component system osmolarity sensor histidine kinase EnvZ